MGCDVHIHAEVKINGKWEHLTEVNLSRNYSLFYKMAGVRGSELDIEPIDYPRGLPNDISRMTKIWVDYWDGDGHSHSWLNYDEIDKVTQFLQEHYVYDDNTWELIELLGVLDIIPEFEDLRIVFWFDN